MHVDTLQMDPRIARIHYLDYRKKLREYREKRLQAAMQQITVTGQALRQARGQRELIEKEDEELMRAYRAMSLGQRVLNLTSVLRKAGVNKQHHPNLAIARADWKECFFQIERSRTFFSGKQDISYNFERGPEKEMHMAFASTLFPAETANTDWRKQQNLPRYPLKAIVPAIPVHLRPAGNLSEFHILWEARWEPAAPLDPILLRHVGGQIYTVLAQWDLSPLEQAILEGRIA